MKRKTCFIILLLFLTIDFTSAKIKLPALIGDRMVLQRDTELKIWGWADVNEKVTVRFRNNIYYTQTGEDGIWSIVLPAQQAGGPFLMEVNEIIIRDILIGDVWLCSGQSNMETPIERLVERFPEIEESNNHMIRYFKVPTQKTIETVQENIAEGGKWYSAIASEVMNWTALAYFYAQEAYLYTGIPVGMLVSSLGGSGIESWISQDNLKEFPSLHIDKNVLDSLHFATQDIGAIDWVKKNWDDENWSKVQVPGNLRAQGIQNNGVIYFRKSFEVPDYMEGRHAKLYLGNMTDSDSVFINGHFIGSTSYMYPPRKYDIPAGILSTGENNITIRLRSNSVNGGFIEDKVYQVKGDDFIFNLSGEWKYKVAIDYIKVKSYTSRLQNIKNAGSGLFNGMIYPLRNYKVCGVIWYQGESNSGNASLYQKYLESLISNWRILFDKSTLPFLLVQLPNFMKKKPKPSDSDWAKIREAQLHVSQRVPHVSMAVTYDLGEWNDIHPLNKKDISKRLFIGARKIVYGENINPSGPVFNDMTHEDSNLVLSFTNVGNGLAIKNNKTLKHFAIAGEDQQFVWANAVIKGNKVIVSHPEIKKPVAVRYAWSDNPEDANLINKDGLLASPFRTDNW